MLGNIRWPLPSVTNNDQSRSSHKISRQFRPTNWICQSLRTLRHCNCVRPQRLYNTVHLCAISIVTARVQPVYAVCYCECVQHFSFTQRRSNPGFVTFLLGEYYPLLFNSPRQYPLNEIGDMGSFHLTCEVPRTQTHRWYWQVVFPALKIKPFAICAKLLHLY